MALPAQRTGVSRLLFERAWNPPTTGVLVGIVAVIAWPASWASGRHDGLGITTPSSNLVGLLVTGDRSRLDWGVLLVVASWSAPIWRPGPRANSACESPRRR